MTPVFATIIVPTLNEEEHIAATVDALLPVGRHDRELIVVDGGSSDRTVEIVEDLVGRRDRRIRLIHNPARIQSAGVNRAVRRADTRSSVIVRADAHCQYPPGYVDQIIEAFERTGADSVVVPMRTTGIQAFQRAVAAVQNSRLGNGGAAHRYRSEPRWIDHGHHAGFRRSLFEQMNGYDESFSHNEDAELDHRILAACGRIWLEAGACIEYYPRKTFTGLARQYFAYGRGRARTQRKHGIRLKIRQSVPLGILAGCMLGIGGTILHPWLLAIPSGYGLLCSAAGFVMAIRDRDPAIAVAGPIAMTVHLSWATGFLVETIASRMKEREQQGLETA